MGEVAETMTKKRKKKGRPSLLDIQKRSLKQQQQQEQQSHQINSYLKNPNFLNLTPLSNRRSTRRQSNLDDTYPDSVGIQGDEEEREERTLKTLHVLNSHPHHHFGKLPDPKLVTHGSDPNDDYGSQAPEDYIKRRKIIAVHHGSNEKGEKIQKATDTRHGSLLDSGPTTPLPDRKLLVFILDRLRKKDTYGVFSEPVDPEELPDYHEIVANPMDFGTVRKKLEKGAYANLEQFEKDIFLICSNAMEYNSPDTIYFRQARSIQEIARKDFETLRQESDSDDDNDNDVEPQPKVVRRGRPPGKSSKKLLDTASLERIGYEFCSDATLASGGDTANLSGGYNLRKGINSYKFRAADTLGRASYASHIDETYSKSDWENEFPASVVKAVMKYGKKQLSVDENRRDTYYQSLASVHEAPFLSAIEVESKQLTPVGLSNEHGYARSLSRFAADLGPVAWRVASKKIQTVLPNGVNFGPGWVDVAGQHSQKTVLQSEKQKSLDSFSDNHSTQVLSRENSMSNCIVGNRHSLQVGETMDAERKSNPENEFISQNGVNPVSSFQTPPNSVTSSERNGITGGFMARSAAPMLKSMSNNSTQLTPQMLPNTTIYSEPGKCLDSNETTNLGDCSSRPNVENPKTSWSGTSMNEALKGNSSRKDLPYPSRDFHPIPPDLNVRFLSPGSPSSSLHNGSSQQPDLALQL